VEGKVEQEVSVRVRANRKKPTKMLTAPLQGKKKKIKVGDRGRSKDISSGHKFGTRTAKGFFRKRAEDNKEKIVTIREAEKEKNTSKKWKIVWKLEDEKGEE